MSVLHRVIENPVQQFRLQGKSSPFQDIARCPGLCEARGLIVIAQQFADPDQQPGGGGIRICQCKRCVAIKNGSYGYLQADA
jgi:hypothetical protein